MKVEEAAKIGNNSKKIFLKKVFIIRISAAGI
jgi:hypothetical protein